MTNPFERSEVNAVDFAEFHEWLEETADREGSSPEEVLGQLVSTYWILTELNELSDERSGESLGAPAEGSEPAEEPPAEPEPRRRSRAELVDLIRTLAGSSGGGSPTPERPPAIDPSVLELVELLIGRRGDPGDAPAGPAPPAGDDPARGEELARLAAEVADLEADLEGAEHRLSRTMADLLDVADELAGAVEDNAAAIADLRTLEEAGDAELAERVERLADRFEASYADVRTVLTHLLDASAEFDERLDALAAARDDDLRDLREHVDAQRRLAELKAVSARRDIPSATCASCDREFDIALLARPACPHCDSAIEGFDVSGDAQTDHRR